MKPKGALSSFTTRRKTRVTWVYYLFEIIKLIIYTRHTCGVPYGSTILLIDEHNIGKHLSI